MVANVIVQQELVTVLDGIKTEMHTAFGKLEGSFTQFKVETDRRLQVLEDDKLRREVQAEAKVEHEGKFFTRRQRFWAVIYSVIVVLIFLAGDIVPAVFNSH